MVVPLQIAATEDPSSDLVNDVGGAIHVVSDSPLDLAHSLASRP
jgi:hypothetical protein